MTRCINKRIRHQIELSEITKFTEITGLQRFTGFTGWQKFTGAKIPYLQEWKKKTIYGC